MSNSTESKRRALFCCHYARLGDVAEAARCAGYPPETAAADGAAAHALLTALSGREAVDSDAED